MIQQSELHIPSYRHPGKDHGVASSQRSPDGIGVCRSSLAALITVSSVVATRLIAQRKPQGAAQGAY